MILLMKMNYWIMNLNKLKILLLKVESLKNIKILPKKIRIIMKGAMSKISRINHQYQVIIMRLSGRVLSMIDSKNMKAK